ncbi:flavin-binding monooxygenase-like protein [Basidiobolus meristosporus CBS 931.73]|uniref:Flavin-binding monooxygenase-like protein n=1 Tax=Basidiobolus meristosporus CBS 931.73 TaxID=1314790 RepID=A0A1Y1XWE6_9FUNG|nr:flavin-binding monooxygenase-like protein [Basidiobolus meristosporus CBS 931.73]|eukprot:ORX90048.1 flavin-binding monooxygenase-like protein [Basidiobolus meristosporus CBS 931.73]
MCIAIQLKRTLGLDSFTIYESGDDLGGTWLANKYPGCACDIPSHVYSFSFEPNPDWSEKFSQGPEILNYCRNVAKKYNLYPYTKLRTTVNSAFWDKEAQLWRIKIQERDGDEKEVSANIIVSGVGLLRTPAIPEKFTNFKGPYIHSAQWNSEFDVEGKDVAIIGNGASAIQIIPEIVNKVKTLYVYQRTPSWIVPRNNYRYNGVVKWIFRYVPFVRRVYRWFLFLNLEMRFGITQPGTWISRMGARRGLLHMKNQVTDLNKRSLLTPHYAIGCKRIVVSDDYFPALDQPHVHIETSPITGIEGHTVLTESNKQTVDAMILATGFRVQDFLAPLKVYGKGGNEISEVWQSEPKSYLGIMSTGFPNMFMLLGPNTGLGHNSALFMIECQANYTVKMVSEMMKRNCRSVEVKKSAQEQFDSKVQKELSRSVWATGCRSWYKNHNGIITALWSGNCIDYWRATRSLKVSDIQFVK